MESFDIYLLGLVSWKDYTANTNTAVYGNYFDILHLVVTDKIVYSKSAMCGCQDKM